MLLLGLCVGCAGVRHTRVRVAYTRAEPVQRVAVEAENATGRDLPAPPPGLIEQAVRLVSRQPAPEASVAEAFARAATARFAEQPVGAVSNVGCDRLQIRLTAWDMDNAGAAGAVVFVSAMYVLLDPRGTIVWQVEQDRLPVRLSGPNLSRYEVERVARTCVELALESLPRSGRIP